MKKSRLLNKRVSLYNLIMTHFKKSFSMIVNGNTKHPYDGSSPKHSVRYLTPSFQTVLIEISFRGVLTSALFAFQPLLSLASLIIFERILLDVNRAEVICSRLLLDALDVNSRSSKL